MTKEMIKEVKSLLVKRLSEENLRVPSTKKLRETAIGILSMRELRGSKDYGRSIEDCIDSYIQFIKNL